MQNVELGILHSAFLILHSDRHPILHRSLRANNLGLGLWATLREWPRYANNDYQSNSSSPTS
ncbi:MAG: hypothetical protein F6K56_23985 [Moorea sp. SIO3G5]|nr:hypothetical protein [Moorena sp. SIO3G5]